MFYLVVQYNQIIQLQIRVILGILCCKSTRIVLEYTLTVLISATYKGILLAVSRIFPAKCSFSISMVLYLQNFSCNQKASYIYVDSIFTEI